MLPTKRKQKDIRASNSAPLNCENQKVDYFTLSEDNILLSSIGEFNNTSAESKNLP